MVEKKEPVIGTWIGFFVWICVFLIIGGVVGAIMHSSVNSPIHIYDTSAKAPEDPEQRLKFYANLLEYKNIAVTEKALAVNEYETVDSFNEFLWLLETANSTECYVDYGKTPTFFSKGRSKKLWVQYDGIYWELRL